MGIQFNKKQRYAISEAVRIYKQGNEQVFQYSGGPGTGKSVVLNAIIDTIGIDRSRVAPMSFIGAAAINMRNKGLMNAKTLHSWLYEPKNEPILDEDNNIIMDNYNRPKTKLVFVPKSLSDIDIMAIDEAGAIPYRHKHEIESRNKFIIATGDLNQLRAVGDKSAYLTDGKIYVLDEVMRQAKGSGIVYLSNRINLGLPIHNGFYGDILVIDREDLRDEMLLGSNIVLCCKNDTRDWVNNHIRSDILGHNRDLPYYGEPVVCRKNNWGMEVNNISLANGLIGKVSNMPDITSFDKLGKTFRLNFKPNNFDAVFSNINCNYKYFKATSAERKVFNDKYEHGERFEFAYAATTHMAQGSQFVNGVYLEEYLSPELNTRLNYTAITRFKRGCIYVKQARRKFYNFR